jgi:predicted phosphodiesterase
MVRLCVLSDIHGNLHALEAVLGDVRSAGVEWTRAQLGEERLGWLSTLPAELVVGGRLVVHGSPRADDHGIRPQTPLEDFDSPRWGDLLLCGHTHQAMHRREGRRHVVSGGSVAWPLDGDPRPGYAVVEEGGAAGLRVQLRRVDYDRGRTVAELEQRGVPWREVVRHYIETASGRGRTDEVVR